MGEELKTLSVVYKGDATDLKSAIEDVNKSMKGSADKVRELDGLHKSLERQLKSEAENQRKYKKIINETAVAQTNAKAKHEKALEAYEKGKQTYKKNSAELKKLKEEVKRSEKEVNNCANAYTEYKTKLESSIKKEAELKSEISQTKNELKNYQKEIESTAEKQAQLSKSSSDFTDKLSKAGNVLSIGVTAPLKALEIASVKTAADFRHAAINFSAATKEIKLSAKELENSFKTVFKDGYGENFEDVSDGVKTIAQQFDNLTEGSLVTLTESAFEIRDTFGYEINESVRAAQTMIQNFGITGEEAFNLIAQGSQQGLDFSGELIDSINEYSIQFKKVGLDAEDMFSIFKSGADNGAWNLDKIGDAVKEFSIRAIDGSNTTVEGYKLLGLNADKTAQKIAKGGEEAKEAFEDIIKRLSQMEDPVKQSLAGVDLFGTMWEDLGPTVVTSLDTANDSIDVTKNTLQEIKDMRIDDPIVQFSSMVRELQTEVLLPLGEELLPMLESASEPIIDLASNFNSLSESEKEAIVNIGLFGMSVGPVLKVCSGGANIIKGISSAFSALAPVVGISGGALLGFVGITAAVIAAGVGLWAYIEKTEDDFRNMGDTVEKAYKKYDESEKAKKAVKELADEHEELNKKLESGALSAEEYETAETRKKEIDKWFIENYGDYISAEEKKNGVRQESIDRVYEYINALNEQKRIELEDELHSFKDNEDALLHEVTGLKTRRAELERERNAAMETVAALQKLKNAYDEGSISQQEFLQKAEEAVPDSTFNHIGMVISTITECEDKIESTTNELNKIAPKIQDIDDSFSQYNENAKKYIDTFGGNMSAMAQKANEFGVKLTSLYSGEITLKGLETASEKVKTAIDKLNSGAELTEDEMKDLQSIVGDLSDVSDKPEILEKAFKDLEKQIFIAKQKVEIFKREVDGLDMRKTVTLDIKTSIPRIEYKPNAKGTKNFSGGLAMVNDEKGVSDPRELIIHDDRAMMFEGRDVIVPLDRGDVVYTASQTKQILNGRIPHFATGKNNDDFGKKFTSDLEFKLNMGWISEAEYYDELIRYRDNYLEKWSDDYKDLTEKIHKYNESIKKNTADSVGDMADNLNELSEKWIDKRNTLGDWDSFGDDISKAYNRIKERNDAYLKDGVLTQEEYNETMLEFTSQLIEGRIAHSDEWIEKKRENGELSVEQEREALAREKNYIDDFFNSIGVLTEEQYILKLSIEADMKEKTAELVNREIEEWRNDAERYAQGASVFGWNYIHSDNEEDYLKRRIKKELELQETLTGDALKESQNLVFEHQMDLYRLWGDELSETMRKISDEISDVESEYADKRSALETSWEVEDRAESKAEIQRKLEIYEGAVTIEGRDKYNELQEQLREIEREEQLFALEQESNEIISRLEEEYSQLEENKNEILQGMLNANIDVTAYTSRIEESLNGPSGILSGIQELIRHVDNIQSNQTITNTINQTFPHSVDNVELNARLSTGLENAYS